MCTVGVTPSPSPQTSLAKPPDKYTQG
uniref:Uncharacterized protein n=1 Tax=Anguilla anguilla TaxID=7936 RepID=A0A0E9V1Q3_ANGAN